MLQGDQMKEKLESVWLGGAPVLPGDGGMKHKGTCLAIT